MKVFMWGQRQVVMAF